MIYIERIQSIIKKISLYSLNTFDKTVNPYFMKYLAINTKDTGNGIKPLRAAGGKLMRSL